MTTSRLLPTPRSRMTGDIREERKDDKNPNLEVVLSRELLGKQQPAPSYSQQELHVSPPVVPGSAEAQAMTVGSGEKLLESLPKSSRSGASLKMLEDSLVLRGDWFSRICFLKWKVMVTKQGRFVFQLVPKTPRTEETGFGLLHTPDASDRRSKNSKQQGVSNQIAMLPTPTATDRQNDTTATPSEKRMIPTPRASDYKGASKQTEAKGRNPMTNVRVSGAAVSRPLDPLVS